MHKIWTYNKNYRRIFYNHGGGKIFLDKIAWKIEEKIGLPQNVKRLYKKHHHTKKQKSDDGLKANICKIFNKWHYRKNIKNCKSFLKSY